MSITLHIECGITITSDSDGVVRTWDISTGLCKSSFQTPVKGANKRDVQMTNGSLVLVWYVDKKINIWDVEKEKLLFLVDGQ
jgi:WD40 repeat protein